MLNLALKTKQVKDHLLDLSLKSKKAQNMGLFL